MKRLACLALLLFTVPLWADLAIKGELKIKRDQFAELAVEGAAKGSALIWDVSNEDAVKAKEFGGAFVMSAPPGSYKIKVRAVSFKDGLTVIETARATVVVEGAPDPAPVPPGPNPPDPTPPAPVAKAWVVIVEETADLAADRGRLFASKELAGYVKAKGWRMRVADKDAKDAAGQTPADLKPFIDRAAGKAYPQLYVVDQAGKVRHEGPLPKDPAEILQTLRKIGGEK